MFSYTDFEDNGVREEARAEAGPHAEEKVNLAAADSNQAQCQLPASDAQRAAPHSGQCDARRQEASAVAQQLRERPGRDREVGGDAEIGSECVMFGGAKAGGAHDRHDNLARNVGPNNGVMNVSGGTVHSVRSTCLYCMVPRSLLLDMLFTHHVIILA